MSPLLTGLFDRLMDRRPKSFEPNRLLAADAQDDDDRRRQKREPCAERALLEWIDEAGERHAEIAWISDRSKDGMGINSPYHLEPGWAVLVTLSEEAPVKAMVRYSDADHGDWRIGLTIVHNERRRHDRSLSQGRATVVWESGKHSRREVHARILNVGEGGIGLSGDASIPEQTTVCIVHEGWQRFGSVTHGRIEGERYLFGVQFAGPPRPVMSPDARD